jgi:hypothetical protein
MTRTVIAQHLDPVTNLQHRAAIHGKNLGPLARFRTGRRIGAQQCDGLADGLLHQRGGRQQVIIEILLDNAEPFARQRYGFGPDLCGYIREFLPRATIRQRHIPDILHQRLIVIVDGDGNITLRGPANGRSILREKRHRKRASQSQEPGCTHIASPPM